MHLSGQLTAFRNIEYFRKYFALPVDLPKQSKHLCELLRMLGYKFVTFQNVHCLVSIDCLRKWDIMYAVWFAIRHPSITLFVDVGGVVGI